VSVAQLRLAEAVTLGVRAGWLRVANEGWGFGEWWLARAEKAETEQRLAMEIERLVE
jgi:hypothetical protein